MKNIMRFLLIITIGMSTLNLFGESPIILPIPREVTPLNAKIKLDKTFVVDGVKNEQSVIGIEEITKKIKLDKSEALSENGFNIILAVKNEGLATQFVKENNVKKLPDKNQGYIIVFGKEGKWQNTVLIMGHDNVGLLYGCVTFRKLINSQGELSKENIYDYPDYEYRFLATFAQLYYRNRKIFDTDKNAFAELCKKEIDKMLTMKINGIYLGSRVLKGAGQQKVMKIDEKSKEKMVWLQDVVKYGKKRGFHFCFFGTSAMIHESDVKDNPRYKGMMKLRGYLFTWSDDELLKQRATELGNFAKWIGIDFLFIHYPDTVNENWVNRSDSDRKRFGDNRAKADANVTNIFYKTFKEIDPKIRFCPVLHPYVALYLRQDYYRKFIKDFASLTPGDIRPALREFDQGPYREMCALYNKPILLYYEQNRFVRHGKTRIGLDRSMLTTSPRMFKSFDNGRRDNVMLEIWSLNPVDLDILNQYTWNINSPGAESNYTWLHRNTPYDGQGNKEFFNKLLYPICVKVFGARSAPEMLKLFELHLLTAFLLQPFAISDYVNKTHNQWYKGKLPETDFNQLIINQVKKLKDAEKIVTELAKHPEYFPTESQQEEFTRYCKEVKLLSYLAPINLCKWEARKLANEDKIDKAKKEIQKGLELVEKARKELPEAIKVVDNFKQIYKRGISSVPCGPGDANSWNGEKDLDKYFKDELMSMQKNIAVIGKQKTGTPLSELDRKITQTAKLIAMKINDNEIKMDGKFDESIWKKAPKLPFVKILTKKDKNLYYPDAKGEAKAVWDNKNLYLALSFDEDDIDSMVGTTGERDKFFFSDDILEIFIQPEENGKYGHLLSNISGRKWDSIPNKTDFGMENDLRWNPEWVTKFYIDYQNLKWQAEVKIPFKSLKNEFFGNIKFPPKSGDIWKVNIGRERRTIEYSSVAPCMSFHETNRYYDLIFKD